MFEPSPECQLKRNRKIWAHMKVLLVKVVFIVQIFKEGRTVRTNIIAEPDCKDLKMIDFIESMFLI